jgi:Undecaprenyl-phosphate glucose phosphotransferase
MLKKHAQLFEGLFVASDLVVVTVAWLFSYYLRFHSGLIPVEKGIPPLGDYIRLLLFVWLIWALVFRKFGLYRPMRGVSRLREIWLLVRANCLAVLVVVAFTYLFREKTVPFSRLVFVIFAVSSTVATIAARSAIRSFLRAMRMRGFNMRYVLIVGAGELAKKVGRRILDHPEYGVELIGCLSKDHEPGRHMRVVRDAKGGALRKVDSYHHCMLSPEIPIAGAYSDLPRFLHDGAVDQVIVALPLDDHQQMASVIADIGDSMVDVRIVPDFHAFIQLGSMVEEFDGLPVVSLASTPLAGFNQFTKRVFDLLVGSLMFVVLLPLMLVIAVLVKIGSKGPIFFSQERMGLDGKTFSIFKFRTMSVDAEANGAQFAVKNDTRTTTLGKFLRRFNLDELPQLVNVIKGQMSLVGPRPERPVFIQDFRKQVPRYMLRHKVQAGMTGWAQVHGWRGNTSIDKRIEYDLFYIENWSLVLDIKIMILTLINSFRDRNAY